MLVFLGFATSTYCLTYGIDNDNVAMAIIGAVCLIVNLLALSERMR